MHGSNSMDDISSLAKFDGVCFRYPNSSSDLFRDITFRIDAGQVVLLVGPNGCGKSTFFQLITGRLQPSEGSVTVFGQNPARATRAPDLGLVTEPFHPSQSPLPATHTVREVLRWLYVLDNVTEADALDVLDRLGLPKRLLKHPIRDLSKGERQRVMLAVTLLRQPTLILADEPLEGIDKKSRRIIAECLGAYVETNRGRSIIWISHHVAESGPFADRLFEIEDRRIQERPLAYFDASIARNGEPDAHFELTGLHSLSSLAEEFFEGSDVVHIDIKRKSDG